MHATTVSFRLNSFKLVKIYGTQRLHHAKTSLSLLLSACQGTLHGLLPSLFSILRTKGVVQLCHHIAFLKFCLKYLAPHMMDTGFALAPCLAYLNNNNTVQYLIMTHFACQPLQFWQLYLRDLSTSNPYRVRLGH